MKMRLDHCAVLTAFLCIAAVPACGGKQNKDESSEATVEEVAPTCIEEGWARPPEGIGEAPPSRFPSPDTLKPFEHGGASDASSNPDTAAGAESGRDPEDDRSPLRDDYQSGGDTPSDGSAGESSGDSGQEPGAADNADGQSASSDQSDGDADSESEDEGQSQ